MENFGIDEIEESVPDLFNSEKPETSEQFTSFENKEESNDEDELEIPAFLRRQKELMFFNKINECHHKKGKRTFSGIA